MKRIWEKRDGEAGFQFAEISFTRGGENMEQPSLLLQLSLYIHQLNIDYTGGGGKGEDTRRGFRIRRREMVEGGRRRKEEERREAFSSRLWPRIEVFTERKQSELLIGLTSRYWCPCEEQTQLRQFGGRRHQLTQHIWPPCGVFI